MKENLKNDKEFNFNIFWGQSNMKPYISFERDSQMFCIYCGEIANTREHCPSKAFLKKPYPTNLPTLPACKKCNNGFSSHERYTKYLLKFLYYHYTEKNEHMIIDDDVEIKQAYESAIKFIKKPFYDKRMAKVFYKLAIGHAVYEISEGYYSYEWEEKISHIAYIFKPMLSKEKWEKLKVLEDFNEKVTPELGSREFRNIYVLQKPKQEEDCIEENTLNVCVLDWTVVQEGQYMYKAFLEQDKICVKMIFMDFLYVGVVFEKVEKK